MASYLVTSPLVIAHREGGTYVHVYVGGFLPEDVDPAQVEQLLGQKMVVEAEPPADDGETEPAEIGGKPAGNASLEEWQEYARSQGATDADLEDVSRNELRDRYA